MKVTVSIYIDDGASEPVVVAEIERAGPLRAATLGLTLAESKHLLTAVQRELVQSQFAAFAAGQRTCPTCGARRRVKDRRRVCFKSLFGAVALTVPRLFGCRCDGIDGRARALGLEGMPNWVAPELAYVQSHLAATVPYARSAQLLAMLLPAKAGSAASSVRRRTLAVGARLEAELREATEADHAPNAGVDNVPLAAMGLDSGTKIPGCARPFSGPRTVVAKSPDKEVMLEQRLQYG